jgi:PST family polysaccharide transporter
MALVFTNFANMVRDMGTSLALIQKEDLTEEIVLTCFWYTVFLGTALGAVVAFLAPLAAIVFTEPRVTGLLLVLALTFPILGSTTVQQALLERQNRFSLLARIETLSAISGLAAGVTAAYLGAGAYSLVLTTLVQASASSGQLWAASALKPRWSWSWNELRVIRRFSDYVVGFTVIDYFGSNMDSLIIGRLLGADSLGLYSLARKIVLLPIQNLSRVASRALYPVMSRQQAAPEEMATLYLRSLSLIAFISAPMFAGLFVLRDLIVLVVLGSKWSAVGGIIFWLAPVGFMHSLLCTSGSVLMARGRSDILFYISLICTPLAVGSYLIGVQWGVTGVAAALFVVTVITDIPNFYIVFRILRPGLFSQFLKSIAPPTLLACFMAVVVFGCEEFFRPQFGTALAHLAFLVPVGVLTYAAGAFIFMRQTVHDALRLVRLR